MSTQAETNRTRYKVTIRLTARERSSLERFIEWNSRLPKEAQLLVGDLSLTCGVLRRVLKERGPRKRN